jgi:hypothetical protein
MASLGQEGAQKDYYYYYYTYHATLLEPCSMLHS